MNFISEKNGSSSIRTSTSLQSKLRSGESQEELLNSSVDIQPYSNISVKPQQLGSQGQHQISTMQLNKHDDEIERQTQAHIKEKQSLQEEIERLKFQKVDLERVLQRERLLYESEKKFNGLQQQQQVQQDLQEELFSKNSTIQSLQKEVEINEKERKEMRSRVSQLQQDCFAKDVLLEEGARARALLETEVVRLEGVIADQQSTSEQLLSKVDTQGAKNAVMQEEMKRSLCDAAIGQELKQESVEQKRELDAVKEALREYEAAEVKSVFGLAEAQKKHRSEQNSLEKDHFDQLTEQKRESASTVAKLEVEMDRLLEEQHSVVLERDDWCERAAVLEQQLRGEEAKSGALVSRLNDAVAEIRVHQERIAVLESRDTVLSGELSELRAKQRSVPTLLQKNADLTETQAATQAKLNKSMTSGKSMRDLIQFLAAALADAWEQQFFAIDRVLEDNCLLGEELGAVLASYGRKIFGDTAVLKAGAREEVRTLQRRLQRAVQLIDSGEAATEELGLSLHSLSALVEDGLSAAAAANNLCVERSRAVVTLLHEYKQLDATNHKISTEHSAALQYAAEKEYLRYISDAALATFITKYLTVVKDILQLQSLCSGQANHMIPQHTVLQVDVPDYDIITNKSVVEMNTSAFIKQARIHQVADAWSSVKGICWLLGIDVKEENQPIEADLNNSSDVDVKTPFHKGNNDAIQTHYQNMQTYLHELPTPELTGCFPQVKETFDKVAVLHAENAELKLLLQQNNMKAELLQADIERLNADLTACKMHRDEIQLSQNKLSSDYSLQISASERLQQDLHSINEAYAVQSAELRVKVEALEEQQRNNSAQELAVQSLRSECVTTQTKLTEHIAILEKTMNIVKTITEEKNQMSQQLESTRDQLEISVKHSKQLEQVHYALQDVHHLAVGRVQKYQKEYSRLYVLNEVFFALLSVSLQQNSSSRKKTDIPRASANDQNHTRSQIEWCDSQLKLVYSLFAPDQEYLPLSSLPVSGAACSASEIGRNVARQKRPSLRAVGFCVVALNRFSQRTCKQTDSPMEQMVQALEREGTLDAVYLADKKGLSSVIQQSIAKLQHKHTLHSELLVGVASHAEGNLERQDTLEPQTFFREYCLFNISTHCNSVDTLVPSGASTDKLSIVYCQIVRNQAKLQGTHLNLSVAKRPTLSFIQRITSTKPAPETDKYRKERRIFIQLQKQQLSMLVEAQSRLLAEQWGFSRVQQSEHFKQSYIDYVLYSIDGFGQEGQSLMSKVLKFLSLQYVAQQKQGKQMKNDLAMLRVELQRQVEACSVALREKKGVEKNLSEMSSHHKSQSTELEKVRNSLQALEAQHTMQEHKSSNQSTHSDKQADQIRSQQNTQESSKTAVRGQEQRLQEAERELGQATVEIQGYTQHISMQNEKLDGTKKIVQAQDGEIIESKKNLAQMTGECQSVHEESNEWRRRFEAQHAESLNRDRRLARTEDRLRQCTEELEVQLAQKEEMQQSMNELIDQVHVLQSKTASSFLDAENQQLRTEVVRLTRLCQESNSQLQNTRNVVTLLSSQVHEGGDHIPQPVPVVPRETLTRASPPPQKKSLSKSTRAQGMNPPPLTVQNQTVNVSDAHQKEILVNMSHKPKNAEWLDQALEQAQTTQFWLKEFK